MARVTCRIADVEAGDLPAICAKTGVACANPVAVRLRVGIRRVHGVLPIVAARARLVRVLVRCSWVLLAIGFVAWFVARPLGVAMFAAYVVLVLLGDRLWLAARPGDSNDEMIVTRVHPNFAAAVDEQYGRANR
jgi:hypothetical protein